MSNQEKETPRIKRLLKEGKLAYINKATLPSEFTASAQGDQSTIPSEVSYSESKDTTSSPNMQEESAKYSLREPIFYSNAEYAVRGMLKVLDYIDELLSKVYAPQYNKRVKAMIDSLNDLINDVYEKEKNAEVMEVKKSAEAKHSLRMSAEELAEIEAERQSIIETAKANGTYLKAPNGKDTNLSPEQWVEVRTKRFKAWFGDWEKAARIEKLRNSESVVVPEDVNVGKYELNRESAEAYLLNELRGEYNIADTNEQVIITRKGAKKVTSHSAENIAHLKSIAAIPQMLGNAIFIDEVSADKDNAQYDAYRYYVCGLRIGNEDYTVRITIGVKRGKYYYDHSLTSIEKGNLIEIAQGFTPNGGRTLPSYAVSKDTRIIPILQTNSSKIVDENGEPKVVWHGGQFGISSFIPRQNMHFGTKKAAMQRILDEQWGYDNWLEQNEDGSYSWKYEDEYDETNNVLAALSVDKGGHDVDFNIISSVYDKREDSVARWGNDGKMLWVDKKKALDYFSVSAPLAEAQNNQELISTTKVIQNFENPKIEPRFSLRELDAPYLDAVERGDIETAQRMVLEAAKLAMPNTKVVDEDGNPKVMYHGDRKKARYIFSTDTFFTPNAEYARRYINGTGEVYATYIDKEKVLNYLHHSAPIAEALSNPRLISTTKIIQNFENPKIKPKSSLRELDAPYLDAVNRGDMETAQRMVLEAVKRAWC